MNMGIWEYRDGESVSFCFYCSLLVGRRLVILSAHQSFMLVRINLACFYSARVMVEDVELISSFLNFEQIGDYIRDHDQSDIDLIPRQSVKPQESRSRSWRTRGGLPLQTWQHGEKPANQDGWMSPKRRQHPPNRSGGVMLFMIGR